MHSPKEPLPDSGIIKNLNNACGLFKPLRLTPHQQYSGICAAPLLSCFRIHSEALLPVHRKTTVTIQSYNASPGYLRVRVSTHEWGTADLLLTTVLYRVSGSSLRVPNFFVLDITS